MKEVVFADAHRQQHFAFFRAMDQPHFTVTAEVDITHFRRLVTDMPLRITPAIVYLLARTAHEVTPFRWRIRGETVVEHERVDPSFSVPTDASEVFSFCTVPYHPDARQFVERAEAEIARMAVAPSFSNEPGRDDYLFLSALPWIRFTSVQHAMHYSPVDSIPRISWGKFTQISNRWVMPLSVQAHHALVDGRHMGEFFQRIEAYFTGECSWS